MSDSEHSLSDGASQQDWEEWEDDESSAVKCLFSSDTFPNIDAALDFDKNTNAFNLREWRQAVSMLYKSRIKLSDMANCLQMLAI